MKPTTTLPIAISQGFTLLSLAWGQALPLHPGYDRYGYQQQNDALPYAHYYPPLPVFALWRLLPLVDV